MNERPCTQCNKSGEIAVSVYFPMGKIAPGPVPDDARGVAAAVCDECRGYGFVKQEAE